VSGTGREENMKTKAAILISILIVSIFSFSSCEHDVALGARLNLDPPTVTIIDPPFMYNASGDTTLTISGTAKDAGEVVYINITIESTKKGSTWKQEWNGVKGAWSSPTLGSQPGKWIGKADVQWSIEIPMDGAGEGEYLISAGAVNNVGNKGPLAQRHFIFDTEPPVVKVLLPVLAANTTSLDSFAIRNVSHLDRLINGKISVKYEIRDDFSIAQVNFILKDTVDAVYYDNTIVNPGWNGTLEIEADEIKDSGGLPPVFTDNKKYLKLITIAKDNAGNEEELDDHGWLAWCPQSDYPWAEGVGATTLGNAANSVFYYGGTIRGFAYDNTGVASIQYTIAKQNGANFDLVTSGTRTNTPLQAGAEPSMFFNFNFPVPGTEEDSGVYRVTVKTTDINGKTSTASAYGDDVFYYTLKKIEALGPLLQSYSGSAPGVYGAGKTITIELNLREDVLISATGTPKLELNVTKSPSVQVFTTRFISARNTPTNKLVFQYDVVQGDTAAVLQVTDIILDTTTLRRAVNNQDVTNDLNKNDVQGFEFYSRIEISTSNPVFQAETYNSGSYTLTLRFSKEIFKGTGNITLTQQGTYLAPAVLSKSDYNNYVAKDSRIANYYTVGTNGASVSVTTVTVDTSEKYILNYDTDTTNTTLTGYLRGIDADKIIIPVVSAAVSRGTSNTANDSLVIDLGPNYGYNLRVKGVNYAVTFPAGLVIDTQSNPVAALTVTARTFLNPGVNEPFIRIQKNRATLAATGTVPTARTIYAWRRTTRTIGTFINIQAVSTSGSSPGSDWGQIGPIGIGSQDDFIGYRQATAPTGTGYDGSYIDIRSLDFATTGRIPGLAFHRSNTTVGGVANRYNYHSSWWQQDIPNFTRLTNRDNGTGGEADRLTNNIVAGIDFPPEDASSPIWVSFRENAAISLYEVGTTLDDLYGRAGVMLYNVYVQGTGGTNPVVINYDDRETEASPGEGFVKGALLRVESGADRTAGNLTARQPVTTNFKIDCQTPGAAIWYTNNMVSTAPFAGPFNMGGGTQPKPAFTTISTPSASSTSYGSTVGAQVAIGSTGTNFFNGELYCIRAIARANNNSQNYDSTPATEVASRSVIMFSNVTEAQFWSNTIRWNGNANVDVSLNAQAGVTNKLQLWIRGGDNVDGNNSTPGFPLSWSEQDRSGIRLFTSPADASDNVGTWYWISWEITVPAYFHFIAGTTPRTTASDIAANGPVRWSYAKNNWALQRKEYPLYPGGSLLFTRNTVVSSPATEYFEFYDTFSGSR
jgi:hypothetical protein